LRALVLVFTVALCGCPSTNPSQGLATTVPPDQLLDYDQFVCTVEPVLIRRCSYLGCHGNADHALRIYSPGKLRLGDPTTRAARDAMLTAEEVERNFESASGVVYSNSAAERQQPSERVLLLEKPLSARAGGAEHHGVGIFPVYPAQDLDHDPEWKALVAWVGGGKQPSPVDADCAQTFMIMGLEPR
jgi:hypothetical protein